MPVIFDFNNGLNNISTLVNVTGTGVQTGVILDANGPGASPVRFSFSTDGNADVKSIRAFNGLANNGNNVQFADAVNLASLTNNDFTIRFDNATQVTPTAPPSMSAITGTTGSPIQIAIGTVLVGTWNVQLLTKSGTPTDPAANFTVTSAAKNTASPATPILVGSYVGAGITGVRFSSTDAGAFETIAIRSIQAAQQSCFCAGTQISTADGAVPVETLKAGDRVLTTDGTETTVKWLGRQTVDVRLSDPREINPICITAGALGDNVPARDLWVSGDHAIGIDGYLVNAGALVNGSTIYQVAQMPMDGFVYYHIETDAHELLLADGCPAESFLDYAAEDAFENSGERDSRVIPAMSLPRITTARMLPEVIRARIAEHASTRDRVAA
jgi:hypothetical protein